MVCKCVREARENDVQKKKYREKLRERKDNMINTKACEEKPLELQKKETI